MPFFQTKPNLLHADTRVKALPWASAFLLAALAATLLLKGLPVAILPFALLLVLGRASRAPMGTADATPLGRSRLGAEEASLAER
jgi:hypothetical protein